MDNRKIFAVSLLIIALSVAYYFVIFLPQQQREKQAFELLKQTSVQEAEEVEKQVYENCANEANNKARDLLKSKIELLPNGQEKTTLQEAYDKELFLKDDYNSYFDNCLKRNGVSQ